MNRRPIPSLILVLMLAGFIFSSGLHAEEYEVVRHQGSEFRGHLWFGDGPAEISSSQNNLGNRFRLGAELQLGSEYQFIIGWTALDIYSSGETSSVVGDISRSGTDLNLGYFIVPDKLWIMYSFYLGGVHGSQIFGTVNNYGHGLSTGYRFYTAGRLNLALELEYQHLSSETATTYNFINQTMGSAGYPAANIYSINLRVGFDIGGRY